MLNGASGTHLDHNQAKALCDGELYHVLLAAFPQHCDVRPSAGIRSRTLNVASLATVLGVSPHALYRSLKHDTLSPRMAAGLIEESAGRLSTTYLAQFLSPDVRSLLTN